MGTPTQDAADRINDGLAETRESANKAAPYEAPEEAHLPKMPLDAFYKLQWLRSEVEKNRALVDAASLRVNQIKLENDRRLQSAKAGFRQAEAEERASNNRYDRAVQEIEQDLELSLADYAVREDGVLYPIQTDAPEEQE